MTLSCPRFRTSFGSGSKNYGEVGMQLTNQFVTREFSTNHCVSPFACRKCETSSHNPCIEPCVQCVVPATSKLSHSRDRQLESSALSLHPCLCEFVQRNLDRSKLFRRFQTLNCNCDISSSASIRTNYSGACFE